MPSPEPTKSFVCLNTNGRAARNGEPAAPPCSIARQGTVVAVPLSKISLGRPLPCQECGVPLQEVSGLAPQRTKRFQIDKRILYIAGGTVLVALIGWLVWSNLGTPQMTPPSQAIDFGYVVVKYPKTQKAMVSNTGTATLKITGVDGQDPAFTVTPLPLKIKPGESGTLQITFNPGKNGKADVRLALKTNLPVENEASIQVRGLAVRHDPSWIWSEWEKGAAEILEQH